MNAVRTVDDVGYMHARYGSPLTGRMVSVDPVGGNPARPQSWNRYGYALANPLKFVDPKGLRPQSIFDRIHDYLYSIYGDIFPSQEPEPMDGIEELADLVGLSESQQESFDQTKVERDVQEGLGESSSLLGAAAVEASGAIAGDRAIGRIASIVKPGGRLIGSSGSNSRIRLLEGGAEEGLVLFSRLAKGGERMADGRYPGVLVKLGENAFIGYRARSSSGPPTIDIMIQGVFRGEIKFFD